MLNSIILLSRSLFFLLQKSLAYYWTKSDYFMKTSHFHLTLHSRIFCSWYSEVSQFHPVKLFYEHLYSIQCTPDSNLSVRIRITYNFSHILSFRKLSVCYLNLPHNAKRLRNKADKSISATRFLEEETGTIPEKQKDGRWRL